MSDKNESKGQTPPAPAARLSKEDLLAALSELSPGEKRALGFAGAPQPQQIGTPKMSAAIDAVAPADRSAVMKACGDVLKVQSDPQAMGAAFSALQSKYPDLAMAVTTNSAYRGKTLAHSLRVVVDALNRKAV